MSMRWTLNLSLYVSVIANYIASLTTEYLVVLEKKKTMLLHCCMCTLYKYLLALYVTTKNWWKGMRYICWNLSSLDRAWRKAYLGFSHG